MNNKNNRGEDTNPLLGYRTKRDFIFHENKTI